MQASLRTVGVSYKSIRGLIEGSIVRPTRTHPIVTARCTTHDSRHSTAAVSHSTNLGRGVDPKVRHVSSRKTYHANSECSRVTGYCSMTYANNARVNTTAFAETQFRRVFEISQTGYSSYFKLPEHRLLKNTKHLSISSHVRSLITTATCANNGNQSNEVHRPKNIQEKTSIKTSANMKEQMGGIKELKEDVMTVPNLLTVSRMCLSPVLGYLVIQEYYTLACGIFVYAGISDWLDGWIARNYPNQASAFGSFLDPLADKFLVTIVFLSLTWVNLIPVVLTALVVSRDILLVAAAFYVRYISMPGPITLYSYFNATTVTAELKPTLISKINTGVQLSLVAITLAAPVFGYVDHAALHAYWYLTAATTVASGIGYIFSKDTYRIMKEARSKS